MQGNTEKVPTLRALETLDAIRGSIAAEDQERLAPAFDEVARSLYQHAKLLQSLARVLEWLKDSAVESIPLLAAAEVMRRTGG